MRNKILTLVLSLAVFSAGIYFQQHRKPGTVSSAVYDTGIKAEYGQPIKVAKVVDGDTVVLQNGERLRYIGIDTPEEFDARKPVQCFAKEAAEENRRLVEGREIKFYKDVSEKDKYGRWLGFVYLNDGTFVNERLVQEGYAFAYPYPPDTSKSAQFAEAESLASSNKSGLWSGQCSIIILSGGRKQTNSVETK